MNKLGVHALVWEAGWSNEECARAIANTAEIGYDFIETPALDPSRIDPDFTRLQLEKHGIGINFSLGLDFDSEANAGGKRLISRSGSRVACYVIPTDEELMIARHTLAVLWAKLAA